MSGIAHDLSRRLADRAEAVCRHYLSMVAGRAATGGRRYQKHARPLALCPAPGIREGAGGQMDRCRHRRTWRSSRRHPRSSGLTDFADVCREARIFLSLPHPEPEPAAPRRCVTPAPSGSVEAAQPAVRHVAAFAGPCRDVFASTRHYASARTGNLRFHPHAATTSLTTARPNLARHDRRRHRSHRQGSPAYTAPGSPRRFGQGSGRHAAQGDW